MKYADKTIKAFSEALASKAPAPGGGSVAAIMGILGCGLLSMVANITLAGKGFNGYKERATKALKKSKELRKKLTELIDKDIKAYENLSNALKRNKKRPINLQPALKRAITPPTKICDCVYSAATLALELAYVGSKYILSDVNVAIFTLDAAFESALMNINENLKNVRDKKYIVNKKHRYTGFLHRDMKRIKTQVLSKTRERMFV